MPPSPESKRCNLEAVSGLALATVSGGGTSRDSFDTSDHTPKLARNRSLATLFFQSITMTCVPFGEGGPLVNAVYGGGPLAMVVGWIGN